MDKSRQIWSRYNTDQKELKLDCVDLLSKCYVMLGQKPDTQQIVVMAELLYQDLITHYSRWEIDEVRFAIEKGIREGEDTSCFINARAWNVWLRSHKKSEQLKRQQMLITDYQKQIDQQKLIGTTISKAKQLKQ